MTPSAAVVRQGEYIPFQHPSCVIHWITNNYDMGISIRTALVDTWDQWISACRNRLDNDGHHCDSQRRIELHASLDVFHGSDYGGTVDPPLRCRLLKS